MDVKNYIEMLNNLTLSPEELIDNGHPKEIAKENSLMFYLPTKSDRFNENMPIASIIENCDTQYFEISAFRFTEIDDIGPYILFGEKDSNYLGISKDTGEIRHILYPYIMEFKMGDLEAIEEALPAAAGESEFLKAVYHVAEMGQKILKNEFTIYDTEITEKYVERCASIAGGNKYREFWNIFING